MQRSFVPMVVVLVVLVVACGGSGARSSFGGDDPGASANDGGGSTSGGDFTGGDGGSPTSDSGSVATKTTIYANTDDALYALDPATNAVSPIGAMSGADGNVTDCAVDAAGEVFVNTTASIYKAALPPGGTGNVTLTKVATIAAAGGQKFYALAFAPAGVLGSGETLVGGDGNGELWSIDATTGAAKDLGSFGPDKSNVFALSGDIVFYSDASGKATGLATIRSCSPGGGCTKTNDYLAGIDMAALASAYASGTRAASLLSGIYGGSAGGKGPGIGHGELFGLGAWQGNVFGFERASANGGVPALIAIDTATGGGTVLPGGGGFTNGWSGACVTTKVTVTVPPPPPPPN